MFNLTHKKARRKIPVIKGPWFPDDLNSRCDQAGTRQKEKETTNGHG